MPLEAVRSRGLAEGSRPPGPGRLLLAGLGSIGKRHLDNLRALGESDVDLYRTGAGTLVDAPLPGLAIHRDLEAALSQRPRAVVVSNPTALHVPLALAAARAGAHLFIEKPLSDSLEGVAELEREVASRGLKVLVGFQFRFHPGLRQVHSWLQEGRIGPVVTARAHWGECLRSWHPWEDYRGSYSARRSLGGGVVLTLSHPFDYLRWLLGEVVAVSAQTGQLGGLEIEVEDTAHVLLRFASGAIGTVSLDYVERPPAHWLSIVGRRGRILWDNADGVARLYDAEGRARALWRPPLSFERNTLFLDEMRHFLRCLQDSAEPRCTLDDGVRALRICLAAHESAAAGRSVRV